VQTGIITYRTRIILVTGRLQVQVNADVRPALIFLYYSESEVLLNSPKMIVRLPSLLKP
jgi:hypothetical protein